MQDRLKELFFYQEGSLIRKIKTSNRTKVGDVVGSKGSHGYLATYVDGKKFLLHRLIWIYHNGDIPKGIQIDHINRIRLDNNIENLRLVTHQQNCFNLSNVKGYCYNKRSKSFISYIHVDGETKWLGYYKKEKDAKKAYLTAKEKYHDMSYRCR